MLLATIRQLRAFAARGTVFVCEHCARVFGDAAATLPLDAAAADAVLRVRVPHPRYPDDAELARVVDAPLRAPAFAATLAAFGADPAAVLAAAAPGVDAGAVMRGEAGVLVPAAPAGECCATHALAHLAASLRVRVDLDGSTHVVGGERIAL